MKFQKVSPVVSRRHVSADQLEKARARARS